MTCKVVQATTLMAALPHDGIGTRADWLSAGASMRMFTDGRLVRVARGLYVAAQDDRPLTVARMASLLPDDCTVGGWAAAAAYGVRDAGPTMVTAEPDEVLAYPGRHMHKRLPGFRVLRSDLLRSEVNVRDGVRMTSLARTAFDMVRFAPSTLTALGLLDCFVCQLNPEPLALADAAAMLDAHPRARGNARFRAALSGASSRSRSITESHLRFRLVEDCDVPPSAILVNATLVHQGEPWELDLLDASSGLVLEYDSHFHSGTAQRSRDARKDAVADDVGLTMQRVNVPLLRSPRELVALVARRRATAIAKGGVTRVAALRESGALHEAPLRP